jgi:hypothetical protein
MTRSIVFISIFFITLSCHKDSTENPVINTPSFDIVYKDRQQNIIDADDTLSVALNSIQELIVDSKFIPIHLINYDSQINNGSKQSLDHVILSQQFGLYQGKYYIVAEKTIITTVIADSIYQSGNVIHIESFITDLQQNTVYLKSLFYKVL